jgi:hypothetical protein
MSPTKRVAKSKSWDGEALRDMFRMAATRCENFLACEPQRGAAGLFACGFLGLMGCNAVTRHDAKLSVRAGFRNHELSGLWTAEGWDLHESRAGLFSHVFRARRRRP